MAHLPGQPLNSSPTLDTLLIIPFYILIKVKLDLHLLGVIPALILPKSGQAHNHGRELVCC